ncbi:MAG: PD-(D/E)XK nuclease family protein, partial [Longicatena sp.]
QIKSSVEVVRRSHIELFKKCQHAFNLEVIKEVKQENNAYALHGIILHEIFDKYSKLENISRDDLANEFKERYTNEMPRDNHSFKEKPLLYDQLYEKGFDAIDGFLAFYNQISLPYITEENIIFELEEGLPKVSITMDRVDKEGENLHMLDYKCGKTFTGKKLSEDLQVPLYCHAIKLKYGIYPASFTFLFVSEGKERRYLLRNGNEYVCTVKKKEYVINVDEKIEEVKYLLKEIQKGEGNTMCGDFWHCENMCYYKKNGICNGGSSHIWNIR